MTDMHTNIHNQKPAFQCDWIIRRTGRCKLYARWQTASGERFCNHHIHAWDMKKITSTYVSDRVFEGTRPLSAEHVERLKANYRRTHGDDH